MNGSTRVLVIGGGPAGSTAATLLAREGIDVTLMEKSVFPRYHIGESLLPACLTILDLLGAREKIEAHGFQIKRGGHFVWGDETWDITFGDRPGWEGNYSYQVTRADFDHILLEHAKTQGVTVLEGAEVKRLVFDGPRPTAAIWSSSSHNGQAREHEISFDFLIDASGRAGLMATRSLRTRRHHEVFKNIALWKYWEGAKALPAGPEGAIAICSVPDGWFWGIPLQGDRLGVGLVVHRDRFTSMRNAGSDTDRIYHEAIGECPFIADLLTDARQVTPLHIEQDYSYTADRFTGPGYFLVGDAACFLDPLLSTGVHLAMFSAMLAAACLASMVRGEITEQEALDHHEQTYRNAYLRYLVVISSLYQQYRGKESYFWEAQRLTLRDCTGTDLQQAFVNIISGIEDLRDAQATLAFTMDFTGKTLEQMVALRNGTLDSAPDSLPPDELELIRARFALFNSGKMGYSPHLQEKTPGLYVVTKPRLGLAYFGSRPTAAHIPIGVADAATR